MRVGRQETGERAAILTRLTFKDNFESAEIEVSIPAGTEVQIVNPFRNSGRIPTKWVIVDDRGAGILKRGLAAWTKDFLYFREVGGAEDVDATVLLLRG